MTKPRNPILDEIPEAYIREPDIPVVDERGNSEDPFLAAIVNEAWRTGDVIIRNKPVEKRWWQFWKK